MMQLEPRQDLTFELPQGVVGLPQHRRFRLFSGARDGFYWLQSVEEPELGFVLVDPFPIFHGYAVDVSPADLRDLGPYDRSELLVLTVVTLGSGDVPRTTTNLRGPIVFNLRTHQAKQLVLSQSGLDMCASFDPLPAVSEAV